MVRPEGHYPSAELLRGGPRRVLAAPVRDVPRDRERGGGLVEHRSESTAPAREVGCPGCPQAARDAAALPRGRARVWSVVRVPTVEEEDRRQLHRELRTVK